MIDVVVTVNILDKTVTTCLVRTEAQAIPLVDAQLLCLRWGCGLVWIQISGESF